MLEIENEIRSRGYKYIACIDEVGRGCLAGDVVASALIMPKDLIIGGAKDSKKLTPKKREKLYTKILDNALAVGFGQVDSRTIDRINIKESTRLAMKKAVLNLKDRNGNKVIPDFLLIDAEEVYLDIPQKSIIKGDAKCHGIACASILAKVFRDRQCEVWGREYIGYLIEKNKGYGTKEHREAIKKIGPSPIHRLTFLKKII